MSGQMRNAIPACTAARTQLGYMSLSLPMRIMVSHSGRRHCSSMTDQAPGLCAA